VVVPTAALLTAAGARAAGQVERAGQAETVQSLADFGRQVTSLVKVLQRERAATAGGLAGKRSVLVRELGGACPGER